MTQFGGRNLRQQLFPQIDSGIIDLFDRVLRATSKMNGLTSAVFGRWFSRDPAGALEPAKEVHQGRLLDPEMKRDLRLGQGRLRSRQVEQGAPFGLTQPQWFKPLIELLAPGASDAVEERSEVVMLAKRRHTELVSMLTNLGLSKRTGRHRAGRRTRSRPPC